MGVQPKDLGHGFRSNQQIVTPFYQAYEDVRASIFENLKGKGPVETLRFDLPKDSSDWNEVIFVSETQAIEELATQTLTEKGTGAKMLANFARLMNSAFGKKRKAQATTPKRKTSSVKEELRSPGAPAGKFPSVLKLAC